MSRRDLLDVLPFADVADTDPAALPFDQEPTAMTDAAPAIHYLTEDLLPACDLPGGFAATPVRDDVTCSPCRAWLAATLTDRALYLEWLASTLAAVEGIGIDVALADVEPLIAAMTDEQILKALDNTARWQANTLDDDAVANVTEDEVAAGYRCPCGNTPESAGFEPVLANGFTVVEPTIESGWEDLYRCADCGRRHRIVTAD